MRVRAKMTITEENFCGRRDFVHAQPGDEGEVIHTDKDGNPTVLFSQSSTVVSWDEVEPI